MVVDARFWKLNQKRENNIGMLVIALLFQQWTSEHASETLFIWGSFSYCGKNWNMSLIIVEFQWRLELN